MGDAFAGQAGEIEENDNVNLPLPGIHHQPVKLLVFFPSA